MYAGTRDSGTAPGPIRVCGRNMAVAVVLGEEGKSGPIGTNPYKATGFPMQRKPCICKE